MHELYLNKPDRLLNYPSHRVCAIIDERDAASKALDALIKIGVKEEDIEILYGREGIDLLDPQGTGHGFFSKMAKKLPSFGDMEKKLIHLYESALLHDGYVFVVPANSDKDKETIHNALAGADAREINYFNTWYIESM